MYVYNLLKIHEEKTKENHKRVGSIYVIKIHVPLICEAEVQFFRFTNDKFPNFLHELAYYAVNFIRHLKSSEFVLYWV